MTGKIRIRFAGKTAALALVLLCLCSYVSTPLPAEMRENIDHSELFAIGDSPIIKGNSAVAKKKAISRALMKGVEDYIIYRLGSQAVIDNFDRITREIIPDAKEEIENFHILAEDRIGRKYKVFVKLRVNEEAIEKRLREVSLVFTKGPQVKVLFLVSETRAGIPSYWWKDAEAFSSLTPTELAFHKAFQDRGLNPVNRTMSQPETEYFSVLTSPDPQEEDALKWGRFFSADVVVYGKSEIDDQEEVSISLKVLDVNHAVRVCRESHVERIKQSKKDTENIIETLQRVASRLAATLCRCVRETADQSGGIHSIEITLAGMNGYKQFRIFRDFLRKDVIGVKAVVPSRINADSVSVTVEFKGDRNGFIPRVLNHSRLPFPLRLSQAEEGKVVLNIE